MRTKPDPAVVPLQTQMFANGIRASEACERAGIAPSTWSRWAAGGVPKLRKLRAMQAAINEIVAEDETLNGTPAPLRPDEENGAHAEG